MEKERRNLAKIRISKSQINERSLWTQILKHRRKKRIFTTRRNQKRNWKRRIDEKIEKMGRGRNIEIFRWIGKNKKIQRFNFSIN